MLSDGLKASAEQILHVLSDSSCGSVFRRSSLSGIFTSGSVAIRIALTGFRTEAVCRDFSDGLPFFFILEE
jgi:hypothetical protein